nr:KTSC domain-containing protein [Desulfobacula sp.]
MNEWILTPESSNLARFRYDETSQTLTVQFNSGTTYDYYDVPHHVFEEMKSADSKGKYLNKEIKGIYRYARQ